MSDFATPVGPQTPAEINRTNDRKWKRKTHDASEKEDKEGKTKDCGPNCKCAACRAKYGKQ